LIVTLGVDPGLQICGLAVVSKQANKLSLLDYVSFKLATDTPTHKKLEAIYNAIIELIDKHKITNLSIETSFLQHNAQTFLKLGFVRAIALLAAAQKNMTVQDFTPCQIKEILIGTGKATKQQIQDRVKNLFPSATQFVSYDSSDAIAAAICGCF